MTTEAKRKIPHTGTISGADFVPEVADSNEAFSNYLGGIVKSVTGTNAYKFTLDVIEGLDSHPDGMEVKVRIPNTNTGAVTFEIMDGSAVTLGLGIKNVRTQDDEAFTGGELIAGRMYTFVFSGGSDDHWVLQTESAVQTNSVDLDKSLPFVQEFISTGAATFTAPYRCVVRVWAFGAGGSGAFQVNGRCGGGGAGGTSIKTFEMASGETLSLNIGAGGAGVSGITQNGNAGGDTTVTGTDVNSDGLDISMSAAGGAGGVRVSSGSGTGGAGGAGSGGDVNYQGGDGGTVNVSTGGGGGAAGLVADGVDAGNGSNQAAGAGLNSPFTDPPAAGFLYTVLGPFNVAGLKGGVGGTVPTDGDVFCGGGGSSDVQDSGTSAAVGGSGGSRGSGTGSADGGPGLVVVEYGREIT